MLKIKADSWPWQKGFNWSGRLGGAPLNRADSKTGISARFGGGWRYKVGISIGGRSIIIDLLFGSIRINRKN